MTSPTRQQVLDCKDEKQLADWVVIYCMNLRLHMDNNDRDMLRYLKNFNPCSPTVEGESQCFRLMYRYSLSIEWWNNEIHWNGEDNNPVPIDGGLKTAIVKAAIIREIGE